MFKLCIFILENKQVIPTAMLHIYNIYNIFHINLKHISIALIFS